MTLENTYLEPGVPILFDLINLEDVRSKSVALLIRIGLKVRSHIGNLKSRMDRETFSYVRTTIPVITVREGGGFGGQNPPWRVKKVKVLQFLGGKSTPTSTSSPPSHQEP